MGFGSYTDDDFNPPLSHAQQSHSDDGDLFSTALSFLKDRRANRNDDDDDDDIDDDDMIRSHKSLYGGGGGDSSEHDSGSVGKGAAIEALKMFTSGGGSSSGSGSSEGGMDKNALIGMAMAQAGKLWEEKQSSGSGNVVCSFISYIPRLGNEFVANENRVVISNRLSTRRLRWLSRCT